MLHGILQCAGGSVRPKVHIKVRPMLDRRLRRAGRRGLRPVRRARPLAGFFLLFQVRFHIKGRVLGRVGRLGQGASQVFQRFFLGFLAEKLGIVGRLLRRTGRLGVLIAADGVADKLHHIRRGQRKEHHQPHGEEQQHQDVRARPAAEFEQHGAHAAEDAARPEAGLPPAVEHLHHVPGRGLMDCEFGEDHRHAGAHQGQQRHFGHKKPDPVAGGHQVGQIQKERAQQIGDDAEHPEQNAAQRQPGAFTPHQHQRDDQQPHAGQRHTAAQVGVLGPALRPAGCLVGRRPPRAAAFCAAAAGRTAAFAFACIGRTPAGGPIGGLARAGLGPGFGLCHLCTPLCLCAAAPGAPRSLNLCKWGALPRIASCVTYFSTKPPPCKTPVRFFGRPPQPRSPASISSYR